MPAHQRLMSVAGQLDADADERQRATRAADLAEVEPADVAHLVAVRCVMSDEAGSFAFRVARESRRRRAMEALASAFNAIGEGADVEDAVALLEGAV